MPTVDVPTFENEEIKSLFVVDAIVRTFGSLYAAGYRGVLSRFNPLLFPAATMNSPSSALSSLISLWSISE